MSLTKSDLQKIRDIVEATVERKLEEKLEEKLAPIRCSLKFLLEGVAQDTAFYKEMLNDHETRIIDLEDDSAKLKSILKTL